MSDLTKTLPKEPLLAEDDKDTLKWVGVKYLVKNPDGNLMVQNTFGTFYKIDNHSGGFKGLEINRFYSAEELGL